MNSDHDEFVKKQFDAEYGYYDDFISKVVPGYEEMHKETIALLDFSKDQELRVLDLGIGTGKTAKAILDKFPNATVVGYDFSEKMLSIAKESLGEYKERVEFVLRNIKDLYLNDKFDICISVLAVHHLDSEEKRGLYDKIFNCIKDGGIFINGDVIKQEDELEQEEAHSNWEDFIIKNLGEEEGERNIKLYDSEDIPDKLSDQLEWLREVGFNEVKSVWKHSIYSVFFGKK